MWEFSTELSLANATEKELLLSVLALWPKTILEFPFASASGPIAVANWLLDLAFNPKAIEFWAVALAFFPMAIASVPVAPSLS